jgi:DnaJ-class molecular chaperone
VGRAQQRAAQRQGTPAQPSRCPDCKGDGFVGNAGQFHGTRFVAGATSPCPRCQGKGMLGLPPETE